MATIRNPQVLYIGKTTRDKIVINTALPSKVVTIVVDGTPVLSLSAIDAEGLIDLLIPHTITIETLAKQTRSYLYASSKPIP